MHWRFPSIHPLVQSLLSILISCLIVLSCTPSPRYISPKKYKAAQKPSPPDKETMDGDSSIVKSLTGPAAERESDSASYKKEMEEPLIPPRKEPDASPVWSQRGIAAWYGERFNKKKTANGERFDSRKFTAAHRTLPFNSLVKVTNLANGLSVIVRINDRGPFQSGRIIDLSAAAARAVKIDGTANVIVEMMQGATP